ncbi:MAG: fibronectin type III domain-containing protein [Bacteroidales bacterium]|nr:fibronectin type III domain-containing protein [Bacteroidales bacterium]
MKNKIYALVLFWMAIGCTALLAQQNPPSNVTATALSHESVLVTWDTPSGTTQPLRINLWNQSQMVIYPGGGYQGNDVSCLYGGQNTWGRNINEAAKFKVGDDFTLPAAAHISTIDFYAYQTGSTTTSTITGAYVSIFDSEPVDSTSVPIWTSGLNSVMTSTDWTGIYRTSATALTDTTRPIMRVTAAIDTTLPAGTYWVTVSMNGSLTSGPWCPPVSILGEVSTGNGIQLVQGVWNAWYDGTSLEQLGVPFIVKGTFADENLSGFNIYRDNVQLNTSLIEDFSYTDEGLQMETEYCYTVEAVYSTGSTASSTPACVYTLNDPCTIFTLPYEESFDDYGTGTGTFPSCWTKFYSGTTTTYPYCYATYNYSPPASLYFYASTAYYDIASTPMIDSNININTLRASMMLRKGSANYKIIIGTITNPSDGSTFHPYDTLSPSTVSVWEAFNVDFDQYTGNDHYIAFKAGDVGSSTGMYIDDFVLELIPTCERPSDIATSPDEDNVTISWSPGGNETLWNISYKFSDETDYTTLYGLTDTFYVIQNLTSSTDYTLTFKVQADCGYGDESTWKTEELTFSTSCPGVNIPYEESFDTYGTGSSAFADCWYRGGYTSGTTQYPYISTTNYSSPGSMYFYGPSATPTWAVTPKINASLNTLEATFKLRKSSANYTLVVGAVTDPSDISTFVAMDTVTPSATSTWETFSISFASYTGTGKHIAFMTLPGTATYMYMDNLIVNVIQTCSAPTDVTIDSITTNSAIISWSSVENVSTFNLEYKQENDSIWTSVDYITDTTYTLTGLLDGSSYQLRVNSNCSDGTVSYWSDIATFQTFCLPIATLPYTEEFDTYGTGSGSFPTCFTKFHTLTTATYPYVSSSQHYSGVGALYLYNTSAHYGGASLPGIDNSINMQDIQISFKAYKASLAYKFAVGVMTDPTDPSTFVALDTINSDVTGTWQSYDISLANYTGTGRYITFYTGFSATNTIYIDDVVVDYIPTCQRPYNVTTSDPQTNSLTVSWQSDNINCTYEVQYKNAYEDTWQSLNVTDTFVVVTNLVPNTTYEFQVSALCGDGSQSAWSDIRKGNTSCGIISTFPYYEGFDSYGTGTSHMADCWTAYTSTGLTTYPYINTTHYSGVGSVYMYASSSYYSVAASPEIDSTYSLNQLQISFMLRKTSAAHQLIVGVMSDPDSIATFVPLDTVTPSATSTWEAFDLSFPNYTGNARHFAFRSGSGSSANYLYVDDVVIDLIPTCFRPVDVTIGGYVQNGVTISWTPVGDETSWNIAYMPETDSVWTYAYSVSDTFYQFSGLDANTTYQVMVQADCGSETSEWTMPVTFTTLCVALTTIPYSENFESYTTTGTASYPDCWMRTTNATSNYPYISTTGNNSSRGLYFYSSTATYCYGALPEIDASININSLMLSLQMRKGTATYYLEVGVMTNPYDPSTFQFIKRITPTELNVFEPDTIYFTGYTGNGRFIAIRSDEGVASTMYVDDIVLDYAPDCFPPQQVTVSNILSTSATVSWASPSSITSWELVYGPAGFDMTTAQVLTLGDLSYDLTGLDPNTDYEVYVRANCSDGNTAWSEVSFSTSCTPVTTLPFTEDFDTYGTGTTAFPDCWTKITNNSNYPYIYSTTASTGLTLPGALYFYSTSATKYEYAVMPEIDADLSSLQLSLAFKAAMTGVHHLDVGIMTDANDTSTFELIETIEPRTDVWNGFTVPLTSYTGTGKFIAFRIQGVTTCYVDHVTVDYAPGCVMPHNLVVDSATTTTADVSWTPGHSETEWIVSVGPVGYFPNTSGVTMTVSTPYCTLTGLDPATSYDFYVKSLCSATETSDWSNVATFTTECEMIDSLPYTETFDDYGTGSGSFPTCWDRYTTYITSTQYPYISTTHYSGVGALYFYSTSTSYTLATAPNIDPSININDLRVSFRMYKTSAAYEMKVGVMTDITDISTFTEIATISPSATSTWEEFDIDLSTYTGAGRMIAFVSQRGTTNSFYLDDVMIQYIPTCEAPDNVHLTDLSQTTATIAWEVEDSLGISWDVVYGPTGFSPTAGTTINTTSTSATLTGLTANTTYDVYVKQICGADDESIYSQVLTFSTMCDAINTLPYQENFDLAAGSTSGTTNNLPNCWNYYNNCSSTTYQGYPIVYNSSTYSQSGTNSIRFYTYTSSTYGDEVLIFPEINTTTYPMNTLQLTFDARGYSTSSSYHFLLYAGVMSDVTDISTFVATDTIEVTSTSYSTFTTTFDNYTGTGGIIALWAPHITNVPYNVGYVDNIVIAEIPCEEPTNIQISDITSSSASVTWTAGGSESAWNVAYRETTGSSWSTVAATTSSVTLSNLTPETNYSVRVQSNCGASQSEWSDIETFTTLAAPNCPTPSNLQVAVDGSTATFSWTQEPNTANEWELYFRPTGGTYQTITVQTTSYTLTNLAMDASYEAYVVAHCNNGVNSDPSNVVTFATTTSPTCPAPTNLAATVDHTEATLTWQQEANTANEWQINYRQTTESTWSTAIATTTTYTLTDLVANVNYEAYVVAHCNNGLNSDPSNTVTFETNNNGVQTYLEKSVNLYPNPATEIVSVAVNDAIIVITSVEVYNVYGQLVNVIESNDNPLRINASGLAEGMYYVRVTTDNGVVTKNFVKQ